MQGMLSIQFQDYSQNSWNKMSDTPIKNTSTQTDLKSKSPTQPDPKNNIKNVP